MFGNFIILVSGFLASSPNSVKSSDFFWSSFKYSGKFDNILPVREMSLVSIEIPEDFVKAFTIGKNERVAKQSAFNILPQVGELTASGYTIEEEALEAQLRQLLEIPDVITSYSIHYTKLYEPRGTPLPSP